MGFGPRWREGSRTHLEKKFWEGRANSHLARRQGRSQRRGKRGEWSVRVLGRWRWRVEHWNSGTRSTEQLGWHRLIGVWCSVHDNLQSDRGGLHRYGLACARSVSRRLRIPDSRIPECRATLPSRASVSTPVFPCPLPPAWDQPVAKSFRAVGNREPGTPQLTTRHPRCPLARAPTRATHRLQPPVSRAAQVASGQWPVVNTWHRIHSTE